MYFHLDGLHPQVKWTDSIWDDNALAKVIAGPSSVLKKKGKVELILALKGTGASHLLISSDDAREISSASRRPYPNPSSAYSAYDFESVSPIVFQNNEQLYNKLRSLKPKKGGAPGQANRNYHDGSLDPYRAAFEHGRLLYQILNKIVDPRKYGVDDISWTQQTRVLSFVFNGKGLETRNSEQRKLSPDVLDYGFCEALLPGLTPNFSTAKHFMNTRNKLLGRKQPKRSFNHGTTEAPPFDELPQHIQAIFKDHQGNKSKNPIILLVCREEESRNILRSMGVDTSGWTSGIRDLLLPDSGRRLHSSPRRQGGPSHSRQPSLSGNSYSSALPAYRNRSRSRSPNRLHDIDWSRGSASTTPSSRYQESDTSPLIPQSYAPVYVLDVRELYVKLMQTTKVDGVADLARFFKLTDEVGWCAGNESATIINIWKEMVSSLPIDEQRELRRAALDPSSLPSSVSNPTPTPAPGPESYVYDSDDDRDPNTIQPQRVQNTSKPNDPYGFDESDDSDDD